jgi:hypothetical protein
LRGLKGAEWAVDAFERSGIKHKSRIRNLIDIILFSFNQRTGRIQKNPEKQIRSYCNSYIPITSSYTAYKILSMYSRKRILSWKSKYIGFRVAKD